MNNRVNKSTIFVGGLLVSLLLLNNLVQSALKENEVKYQAQQQEQERNQRERNREHCELNRNGDRFKYCPGGQF